MKRMTDSPDVINFSALERELHSALEAEKKYQRENDAKFRAIHQKVGTYEEFRDIVLASHLKPLDRKDKAGAPRTEPWNALASNNKGHNQNSCDNMKLQVSEFQPRTASEFSRDWRRLGRGNPDEKYHLLLSLSGDGLRGIFRAEVGFGLLGEFLEVLSEGLQTGDVSTVIDILQGLSKTPRFDLNMSLLSPVERETCKELFHKIRTAAVGQSGVKVLFGDDVIAEGSNLKQTKQTHHPETEALCPLREHTSEAEEGGIVSETLNRLILLYGAESIATP